MPGGENDVPDRARPRFIMPAQERECASPCSSGWARHAAGCQAVQRCVCNGLEPDAGRFQKGLASRTSCFMHNPSFQRLTLTNLRNRGFQQLRGARASGKVRQLKIRMVLLSILGSSERLHSKARRFSTVTRRNSRPFRCVSSLRRSIIVMKMP